MKYKFILVLLITLITSCSSAIVDEKPNVDNKSDTIVEPKEIVAVNTSDEIIYDRDVKDPQVMIDSVDVIVKVKVTDVEEIGTFILDKTLSPYQKITFDVLEVLKGNTDNNLNVAYQEGGLVPVDKLVEKRGNEWAEKAGYDQYSKDESKNLYTDFVFEDAYDFKVGEEVVLGLAFEDDYYLIYGNGYSVFTLDDGMLKNVLTNAELESNKIK